MRAVVVRFTPGMYSDSMTVRQSVEQTGRQAPLLFSGIESGKCCSFIYMG
jgi:hypothetical protein